MLPTILLDVVLACSFSAHWFYSSLRSSGLRSLKFIYDTNLLKVSGRGELCACKAQNNLWLMGYRPLKIVWLAHKQSRHGTSIQALQCPTPSSYFFCNNNILSFSPAALKVQICLQLDITCTFVHKESNLVNRAKDNGYLPAGQDGSVHSGL